MSVPAVFSAPLTVPNPEPCGHKMLMLGKTKQNMSVSTKNACTIVSENTSLCTDCNHLLTCRLCSLACSAPEALLSFCLDSSSSASCRLLFSLRSSNSSSRRLSRCCRIGTLTTKSRWGHSNQNSFQFKLKRFVKCHQVKVILGQVTKTFCFSLVTKKNVMNSNHLTKNQITTM